MGYSTDGVPHIGNVPSKPNQFILAGFTGHGMPQIFLSACGIASMIMEKKNFSACGVPRIFETSQKRIDSRKNVILDAWKTLQTQPMKALTMRKGTDAQQGVLKAMLLL
jgi:hypothetical protein